MASCSPRHALGLGGVAGRERGDDVLVLVVRSERRGGLGEVRQLVAPDERGQRHQRSGQMRVGRLLDDYVGEALVA